MTHASSQVCQPTSWYHLCSPIPLGKSVLLVDWKTSRLTHVTRSSRLYTHGRLALLDPPTLPRCYLSISFWLWLLYWSLALLLPFAIFVCCFYLLLSAFPLSSSHNCQSRNSVHESCEGSELSIQSHSLPPCRTRLFFSVIYAKAGVNS